MANPDKPITEVPYIGEKSAEEFRRKIRRNRPTAKIGTVPTINDVSRNKGVADVFFNVRQKENLRDEGARVSFTTEEKQKRNRQSTSTTTERDPSSTNNVGDFRVLNADRREAFEFHQDRSETAQEVDENRRAPITTDVEKWKSDPNGFDFPGIDTPRRKPRREEKDRNSVDPSMLLRPFDDGDDDEDNNGVNIPGL